MFPALALGVEGHLESAVLVVQEGEQGATCLESALDEVREMVGLPEELFVGEGVGLWVLLALA